MRPRQPGPAPDLRLGESWPDRLTRTYARLRGRSVPLRIAETADRYGVGRTLVHGIFQRLAGAGVLEGAWRALDLKSEPFLTKAKVDLMTCEDLWDTAKARAVLGWAAAVGLDEGAPRAVAWLREAGELR